jgi:hypothetical protein
VNFEKTEENKKKKHRHSIAVTNKIIDKKGSKNSKKET